MTPAKDIPTPTPRQLSRFLSRHKVNAVSGCWEWQGTSDSIGRGLFKMRPHPGNLIASRVAWTIHRGPIPPTLRVLHHCDNPACVNPDHLFLGTCRDNTRDMMKKGRNGHRDPSISMQIAASIKRDHSQHGLSMTQLAAKYGTSKSTAHRVIHDLVASYITD